MFQNDKKKDLIGHVIGEHLPQAKKALAKVMS